MVTLIVFVFVLTTVGLFVPLGIATLRARMLPRWCGVTLFILPVLFLFGPLGGWIVGGLVWLALGYVLWTQHGYQINPRVGIEFRISNRAGRERKKDVARRGQRRRFDVGEYHRMGEVGIFFEDDRVELLGQIVEIAPIGSRHFAFLTDPRLGPFEVLASLR